MASDNLSNGDNISNSKTPPKPMKNDRDDAEAHNIPPGFTKAEHLLAIALWGPEYASNQTFGRNNEKMINTFEQPEPFDDLSGKDDNIKNGDLLLPHEIEAWSGSSGWLTAVGYWLKDLPPAEEWADVDEPTPYPKSKESCSVVTLEKTGFYRDYEVDLLDITIIKKGRTQHSKKMRNSENFVNSST